MRALEVENHYSGLFMKKNHLPKYIWNNPVHWIACGFGTGAAPVAPGTFGTLLGVPLFYVMQPLGLPMYLLLTLLMFVVGVWVCAAAANALAVHDHSGIVWDEVVGYLVTMIAVPFTWYWAVAGFALFRLFDIIKPWPINWFDQKVRGGFGIMLDDVLAGCYAAISLHVLVIIFATIPQSN